MSTSLHEATHDAAATAIDGVTIPDSKMATDLRELIRDTETELLFNHSDARISSAR